MRANEMFADDDPLLNRPSLVALVLRAAEEGGASAERCADRLEALFRATGEAPPVGPGRTGCALRQGRGLAARRRAARGGGPTGGG